MSYENPTALRVGVAGTLNGWRVRVCGRLVMGMQEGGETYFWSEYCLVDDSGNSATLVYEETDDGPEWKLFRAFTPTHPLSAREAASKRVGDTANLDGTSLPITLTGSSRVFHIEGTAPEGVEEGDIASYFNVDTGSRMLVASWTGDEIEFYEGLDAPADSVADAFGLPREAPPSSSGFTSGAARFGSGRSGVGRAAKIAFGVLGLFTMFAVYSCFSGRLTIRSASSPPPKQVRQAVPPLALLNGARGSLAQQTYVVNGHTVVEIARVGGVHDRREYHLKSDDPDGALLINGLSGGTKEWHLLKNVAGPLPVLGPFDAAMKRKGTSVNVDGQILRISDLFRSKILAVAGPPVDDVAPDEAQYGFVARDGTEWLIARWNGNQIQFLRGPAVPETEVLAAFKPGPEKAK